MDKLINFATNFIICNFVTSQARLHRTNSKYEVMYCSVGSTDSTKLSRSQITVVFQNDETAFLIAAVILNVTSRQQAFLSSSVRIFLYFG
jgi:hypothetical protein